MSLYLIKIFKKRTSTLFFIPFIFFLSGIKSIASDINLESIKPAMVKIYTYETTPFYKANVVLMQGSGVIVDKSNGLILTNKHVSGGAGIFRSEIQFYNGIKVDARQIYYDKVCDMALLKVDPIHTKNLKQIAISKKDPSVSEQVYLISNNEGREFSCQDAIITETSAINAHNSSQYIISSLNSHPGSSGSPLLNKNLELIGLNFAGSSAASFAVHMSYIERFINNFKENTPHNRRTLGLHIRQLNISDAEKYYKLSKSKCTEYMKKFPRSRGRLLRVTSTIKGFNSYGILKEGDILWKVNNKFLGPDIKDLDNIVDSTPENQQINMIIFRDSKFINIDVTTDSLDKHTIEEVIEFAGVHFFESDETVHLRTGLQSGKALFKIFSSSSPILKGLYKKNISIPFDCFELISINGKNINSIKDLKNILPSLKSNNKFYMKVRVVGYSQVADFNKYNILSCAFHRPIYVVDVDISDIEKNEKIKTLHSNGVWTINNL